MYRVPHVYWTFTVLGIGDREVAEVGACLQGTFSLVGETISAKCFKCTDQGMHMRLPGGFTEVSGP